MRGQVVLRWGGRFREARDALEAASLCSFSPPRSSGSTGPLPKSVPSLGILQKFCRLNKRKDNSCTTILVLPAKAGSRSACQGFGTFPM